MMKEQVANLQRDLATLAKDKAQADSLAANDRKRAEVAENLLKSADDRLLAAVKTSKMAEVFAEERVRVAEAKNEREQKKADERVHSAEHRAQICESNASLAISNLQRQSTRGTSPIGKFYSAVQGKTPRSPTSSASTSATASAEGLMGHHQQPQLPFSRAGGGASPPGTPRVSRTTFAANDWSPCSGALCENSPMSRKGDATPSSQYCSSPSRRKMGGGTPVSARLRSKSPVKGAPQTPADSQMTQIRSQVSQQLKSLSHF